MDTDALPDEDDVADTVELKETELVAVADRVELLVREVVAVGVVDGTSYSQSAHSASPKYAVIGLS